MKKSEEIKKLKHELGRYQKKVRDQSKELASLRHQVKVYEVGAEQTHHAVNLIMARVCKNFGVEVLDEDSGNTHIGYRMIMEKPSEELLAKYAIRTEAKEDGSVTVGLVLREGLHGEEQPARE